jgi:hypothetical protein
MKRPGGREEGPFMDSRSSNAPEAGVNHGRRRLGKALVRVAAVILVATSALHATGSAGVNQAISRSDLAPMLVRGFQGLWLQFSVHLVLVALVLWLVTRGAPSRVVVLGCGLIPLADTIQVWSIAGIFPGTLMLAAAAALVLAGGALLGEPS